MQLSVKNLTGQCCTIDTNPNHSVESVREKVAERFGITYDETKLVFERRMIVTGTLEENGIHSSCNLQVVVERVTKIGINVKLGQGGNIQLEVEPRETVDNIKEMIQDRNGIVADQQILKFGGREIIGGRINHHHIRDGSTLEVEVKSMEIFVRDFEGKTHTFAVKNTDKVERLKQMVYEKTRVPVSQMRLQFGGRQLVDGSLLNHYRIQRHSTIEMCGRLRGGCQ